MKNVSKRKAKHSTGLDVRIIILILVGLVLLLSPLYLRVKQPLIGSEPYLYHRLIKDTSIKGSIFGIPKILGQDPLSFSGRAFTYDLGPIIFLSILNLEVPLLVLFKILPLLLGILTIILFYYLLKKLKKKKPKKTGKDSLVPFISSLILVLSPCFLYTFTKFTNLTVVMPMTLAAFYLFLSERKIFRMTSFVLFILLPLFGFWAVFVPLFVLLVYFMRDKSKRRYLLKVSLIAVLILAFIHLPHLIKSGSLDHIRYTTGKISNLFFDLGGRNGSSIFAIILAIIGLSKLWERKYKNMKHYLLLIFLIIFSFVDRHNYIYLNFFICFLASEGILKLKSLRWESKQIKILTIFILFCGLVFSAFSFAGSISSGYPTKEIMESLTELKEISGEQDIILSHQSNGAWINTIAERKTFMNENSVYVYDISQRIKDTNTIFYSRDIRQTEELIKKHKIKYIYITPNMKEGLVWKTHDEGFLFVAKYSKLLELKYR